MGDLGQASGGSTPSTAVAEYWGGGIPWLVPSEVTRNEGLFISATERTITKAGLANSAAQLLPAGTVMMTSRATIGEVAINTVPMATNQGFINVVCNENVVFNEFLAFWIRHKRSVLIARSHGVTFKEITKPNFRLVPISLPSLPEQRDIARILRAVQTAREARQREVALERERKAALMAHLFTHGTRGEPTKQTPIGEMPESWEVVTLGNVITLQRGFDLPSQDRKPGPFPVVSSSGFFASHIEAKVAGPGVVTGRYGTIGEVFYIETAFWPLNTTLFVKEFKDNDPLFISYFLQTVNLSLLNDKTSVPGINRNAAHAIPVGLPSLAEQQGIAEVLRACDAKIAALERETVLLDELFRAVLEELMTGRMSVAGIREGNG